MVEESIEFAATFTKSPEILKQSLKNVLRAFDYSLKIGEGDDDQHLVYIKFSRRSDTKDSLANRAGFVVVTLQTTPGLVSLQQVTNFAALAQ